jgi:hypothetical protein
MSNEARSVTPPLKSAQARKMFSVVVIAPSPGHVNLRQRRAQHCGETGATGVLVKYLGEGPPFAACPQVLWPAGLRGPQSRNGTFHALLICQGSLPRRIAMRRISCSILTSGLMSLAVCGITQAAPLRPLPTVISNATAANITPVHYYHHWHRHYWRHGGYPIAGFWNYYRTDWPGRGTDVESTR